MWCTWFCSATSPCLPCVWSNSTHEDHALAILVTSDNVPTYAMWMLVAFTFDMLSSDGKRIIPQVPQLARHHQQTRAWVQFLSKSHSG